jgi:hypothetical protein
MAKRSKKQKKLSELEVRRDQHLQNAYMYLRGGAIFGGAPVEESIRTAANVLEPKNRAGFGTALAHLFAAHKALFDAACELGSAHALHREICRVTKPKKGT